MVVLPVLFLLGSLFLCNPVQAQSDTILMLKQAARMLSGLILLTNSYITLRLVTLVWRLKPYLFALLGVPLFFPVNWKGALTCETSDCNCTFNQQRGCCCAARDMLQLEEDILERMTFLWHDISTLKGRVQSLTGEHPCLLNSKCFEAIDLCCSVLILPSSLSDKIKVAFKATMDPNIALMVPGSTERCFGPFNINIPVPFNSVLLNSGNGYNPSLGKTHTEKEGLNSYDSYEFNSLTLHSLSLQVSSLPPFLVFTSFLSQPTHLWERMGASTIK